MNKIRLIGVLALTLLFGALASPTTFGATANSHTSVAAHSPKNAAPATIDTPRSPAASYYCSFYWQTYQYKLGYICIVNSGSIEIVAYCNDGSVVSTGWFRFGTWTGYIYCPSGIRQIVIYTAD